MNLPPLDWLLGSVALIALASLPFLVERHRRYWLKHCPRCKKPKQHLEAVTTHEVWICTRCGHKSMSR